MTRYVGRRVEADREDSAFVGLSKTYTGNMKLRERFSDIAVLA